MKPPFIDVPEALTEQPPADRYCDVVLNGGVASGVVYPWALLKLARHYRFKSIGGNSVGAVAAAVLAAAEYGRCNSVEKAFEPLRRMPLELAAEDHGQTQMLRLFQPRRRVWRLFALFLAASRRDGVGKAGARRRGLLFPAMRIYGVWPPLVALLVLLAWAAQSWSATPLSWAVVVMGAMGAAVLAAGVGACRFYGDLAAMAANGYGLCTGRSTTNEEALVEWLHRGVQLSAGRGRDGTHRAGRRHEEGRPHRLTTTHVALWTASITVPSAAPSRVVVHG